MTKPIVKMCHKLLHVIQGVKSILIKWLTSWPQLISKLLVAPACLHVASDWPRTFFTLVSWESGPFELFDLPLDPQAKVKLALFI